MISLYHKPLMITLVEFTVTTQEIWMLSMLSLLLDTVLKMAINTGLSETHGEPSGVRKDSSASAEEPTTLQLKVVAIGPHLLTPGLKRKLINEKFHGPTTMKINLKSYKSLIIFA